MDLICWAERLPTHEMANPPSIFPSDIGSFSKSSTSECEYHKGRSAFCLLLLRASLTVFASETSLPFVALHVSHEAMLQDHPIERATMHIPTRKTRSFMWLKQIPKHPFQSCWFFYICGNEAKTLAIPAHISLLHISYNRHQFMSQLFPFIMNLAANNSQKCFPWWRASPVRIV